MHLRHLREKMILKQRIDELARKLEVSVTYLLVTGFEHELAYWLQIWKTWNTRGIFWICKAPGQHRAGEFYETSGENCKKQNSVTRLRFRGCIDAFATVITIQGD